MLEPEALSMYSECRRGALAQSRTLCEGCGRSGLKSRKVSWAILGGSQKRPQAILSGSQWVTAVRSKDLQSLDVHRSSRTHLLLCV